MFYDKSTELVYFTAETGAQRLTPNVPLPSPESPLVLPGEPNPSNKPGLIPIFQYMSNLYQQYLKDQINIGYLMMQVTTAYGTQTVPNAKITVSKPLGNNIFLSNVVITDEDGKSPSIPLPSRSADLSQTPEYPVPYTVYNVTAQAPGFYDLVIYDIPIFPGVTSTQTFDLIPVDENPPKEIYASSVDL